MAVLAQEWTHMWGPGWGWWMGIGMLLFWVVVAWVVVEVARTRDGARGPRVDPHEDARRILAQRLARGEIDSSEYRERLDALG